MPDWLIQLQGDPFDLQALAFFVQGDDLAVEQRSEDYYLRSAKLRGLGTDREAFTRAEPLVELLNGAATLSIGGHSPVGIGGIIQVAADGSLVPPSIFGMAATMAGGARVL